MNTESVFNHGGLPMPVLFALQTAFSLFMLYDAVSRGAERYWWIIVMVPFGEWVYFFAVYVNTPQFNSLFGSLFKAEPNLEDLRYEAQQCPSFNNRFRYAEMLQKNGKTEEAVNLYKELQNMDSDNLDILYNMAMCQIEQKQTDQGIKNLWLVIKKSPAHADYKAAESLIKVLWDEDQKEECLSFIRDLAKQSHRSKHQYYLADTLVKMGKTEEAIPILEDLFIHHRHSAPYVKNNNKEWLYDARRLRKKIA